MATRLIPIRLVPSRLLAPRLIGSGASVAAVAVVPATSALSIASAFRPTVQELIDTARSKHWAFADVTLGDGAAVLFLNQRQRTLLASMGPEIEGLVGTSLQYTLSLSAGQTVVALLGGVPVVGTTYQDGFAQHLTADGVPYIDPNDLPIVGDPFGAHGGTPGVPLPADFVRLISVGLVYGTQGRNIPCDVIGERERYTAPPGRNPQAFISGNRLVPVFRNATPDTSNRWFTATALQVSYVPLQMLSALTDLVMLPSVLCEVLTADLASLFADQAKECTPAERTAFASKAASAAGKVAAASMDMLESVQTNSVHFRGY